RPAFMFDNLDIGETSFRSHPHQYIAWAALMCPDGFRAAPWPRNLHIAVGLEQPSHHVTHAPRPHQLDLQRVHARVRGLADRPRRARLCYAPGDRQWVDMNDAPAIDTLKALKASDQVVQRTPQASQIIEDEARRIPPRPDDSYAAAPRRVWQPAY